MSRVIKCDRCGKEIDPKRIGYVSVMERKDGDELTGKNPFEDMDFCGECMELIAGFITNAPATRKTAKTPRGGAKQKGASVTPQEKKQEKRPRIDRGKICALAANNWPVKEIAADVGCSEQTVRQVLKESEVKQ